MRNLISSLLLAVSLSACAVHNPPVPNPVKDWTIKASWTYDFTNFQPCSTTVTKGCISGFTWGYLQGSAPVPLKTSAATACTGATQPEACLDSMNGQLGIGSLTFYVAANYVDNSGNSAATAQATTANPVPVAAGLPANFTVTVQ